MSLVSPARVEALTILCRVEEDQAFADLALEAALERAKLPARDRALTTEIVYGTLRWQRRLDWILAPHSRRRLDRLDPWVRNLLRLTTYQLQFLDKVPAYAAVNDAVALAKRRVHGEAAPFVNAVLRSLTRSGANLSRPARSEVSPSDDLTVTGIRAQSILSRVPGNTSSRARRSNPAGFWCRPHLTGPCPNRKCHHRGDPRPHRSLRRHAPRSSAMRRSRLTL